MCNRQLGVTDWRGLWQALLEVTLQSVNYGVKVLHIDNPHTKPYAFLAVTMRTSTPTMAEVVFPRPSAFHRRGDAPPGEDELSQPSLTWKN